MILQPIFVGHQSSSPNLNLYELKLDTSFKFSIGMYYFYCVCTFQLENGLTLKTQLQCKFNNEKEVEHSKWGNKLTSIEYECQVSDGHTFVNVTKERYL